MTQPLADPVFVYTDLDGSTKTITADRNHIQVGVCGVSYTLPDNTVIIFTPWNRIQRITCVPGNSLAYP